jgi:hypothetical protein
MLLWFDFVGASEVAPMGSALELPSGTVPRFRVRAVGSFEQLPGCPEWVEQQLGAERIEQLCLNECHNPGDARRAITRIEVIRIRPQRDPSESLESLIEDPWRSFDCADQTGGCTIEFDDPEFASGGRQFIYYVRAIQAPTPAVNAGGLRCEGESCQTLDPCYGDYRTGFADDCLSDNEERAWSSPIWLSPGAP